MPLTLADWAEAADGCSMRSWMALERPGSDTAEMMRKSR